MEVITLGTKHPALALFPTPGNTDSRANLSSRKDGRLAKLISSPPLKHSKKITVKTDRLLDQRYHEQYQFCLLVLTGECFTSSTTGHPFNFHHKLCCKTVQIIYLATSVCVGSIIQAKLLTVWQNAVICTVQMLEQTLSNHWQ